MKIAFSANILQILCIKVEDHFPEQIILPTNADTSAHIVLISWCRLTLHDSKVATMQFDSSLSLSHLLLYFGTEGKEKKPAGPLFCLQW